MFGGPWDAHGQMFLTLEAMGVEHKVHAAVFDAIQNQKKRLTDPQDMADFLATQGVDKDKFLATFNSFAIKGQVNQPRNWRRSMKSPAYRAWSSTASTASTWVPQAGRKRCWTSPTN